MLLIQGFVFELLDEEQQEYDRQEQDCDNDAAVAPEEDTHQNSDVDVDADAEYYKVAAEQRACRISDFVFVCGRRY